MAARGARRRERRVSHAATNGTRPRGRRSSRREAGSTWLSGTADGVGPNSRDEFDRARAAFPGGVNSPVRAFGSVGGTPLFVASARGAYLSDCLLYTSPSPRD